MADWEMYMYRELSIKIGADAHKLFFSDGFYQKHLTTGRIHSHTYAEVHLVLGAEVVYRIGEEDVHAASGTMLVIPAGVFHAGAKRPECGMQAAFQIDADVADYAVYNVGEGLVSEMLSEIERASATGDHAGISALAVLLCRRFLECDSLAAEHITDYGFLIYEFFQNHYGHDVHLSDLAASLHLSDRQTERLVIEHTGGTFRDELTATRVRMAERLLAEGGMSQSEVASYVGYKSYAGFWKAMKKYGNL